MVKNSPILQTETIGEGDAAVFRKISDEETDIKLPSLVIEPREASKEEMVGKAKSRTEAIVSNMATEGQLAHRTSVRLHAVRGPRHIAFVLVTPHHFVDGTGIASIITQMYLRSLLPKKLWWLLPTQLVMPPSFMEMAYKSGECLCQSMICNFQSHTWLMTNICLIPDFVAATRTGAKNQQSSVNLAVGRDEINVVTLTDSEPSLKNLVREEFRFVDYDLLAPDASTKLRGLHESMSYASLTAVKKCRRALRQNGISMTSAFGALSIKVLAALVSKYCQNSDPPKEGAYRDWKYLKAQNGVDARGLGKWGDKRDRASKLFPTVANYAFSAKTFVPFDDALNGSLEKVALMIKETLHQISTDVKFRASHIESNKSSNPHTIYCGVSSVLAPRIWQVLRLGTSTETTIEFGPCPHVWFYVLTDGAHTSVIADIGLPLPTLTEDATRDVIRNLSKGTALESFFTTSSI